MLSSPVGRLRAIGLLEGISFLLLLGVAMPLKYVFDLPLFVKFTGWAHGVLFIAYTWALLLAWADRSWPLLRGLALFIAALVPFGPFLAERWLKTQDTPTSPP